MAFFHALFCDTLPQQKSSSSDPTKPEPSIVKSYAGRDGAICKPDTTEGLSVGHMCCAVARGRDNSRARRRHVAGTHAVRTKRCATGTPLSRKLALGGRAGAARSAGHWRRASAAREFVVQCRRYVALLSATRHHAILSGAWTACDTAMHSAHAAHYRSFLQ